MLTGSTRYWAFLSYSHADEAAAARLHRALERYTLPAAVRRAHGLPKRLIPVFRDVEELEAAAGLSKRLETALDESRWLIVLCSAASARSKYVNAEISYFLKRHGPERILCVLQDGEPPDSFPPAIQALDDEPLAADLRRGADPDLAVLKLVAAMATVGFTELRNREAERRRRQRILAAAAFSGIGLGALAYWDLFHREHVDYYVGYVREHGIWQGVDRMAAETASHRNESYRFTRHGRLNPPDRVDYVNGGGKCPHNGMAGALGNRLENSDPWGQPGSRFCAVGFSYHGGGDIARETWMNPRGRPLETLTYTESGLAQFTQQGFSASGSRGGVQYVHFMRDAAGRDATVLFLHSRGVPRPNNDRHFGYRNEYDGVGRLTRQSALDDQGREIGEVTRWAHDANGYLREERYEDGAGGLRTGDEGFSFLTAEVDAFGNWTRNSFFDENSRPVLCSEGFAAKHARWDERGNGVEFSYFDVAGKPVMNRYGHAMERMTYDDAGNPVRWEWLDTHAKPVTINGGYAAIETTFDPHGQPVENRYLDTAGKLTEGLLGAIVRNQHDEAGRQPEECYFDAQGRPFVTRYGHCITRKFDERDNIVEFLFLDTERRPFARSDGVGFARAVIERDAGGNITRAAYFDAELKPVTRSLCGCAVFESSYDEFGNRTELRRYDAEHRLMRGTDGVSVKRFRFDRSGNRIEERCFGTGGEPVRSTDGAHGYRASFDRRSRMIEKRFLDPDGSPGTLAGTRIHAIRHDYDAMGEISAEAYSDLQDELIGQLTNTRDRYGHVLEARYANHRGEPAPHPQTGCAIRQFEGYGTWGWDEPTLERCLDEDRRPVNRKDTGWATKKATMTSGVLREEFLDATGRAIKPKS